MPFPVSFVPHSRVFPQLLHRLRPRPLVNEPETWLAMIHKVNKLCVGDLGIIEELL